MIRTDWGVVRVRSEAVRSGAHGFAIPAVPHERELTQLAVTCTDVDANDWPGTMRGEPYYTVLVRRNSEPVYSVTDYLTWGGDTLGSDYPLAVTVNCGTPFVWTPARSYAPLLIPANESLYVYVWGATSTLDSGLGRWSARSTLSVSLFGRMRGDGRKFTLR